MSETATAAPAQAPATPPPTVETPAVGTSTPAAPPPTDDVRMSSSALKARLEEERQKGARKAEESIAKTLGVSVDEARAAIEKARALEAEKLSELEKRDLAIKDLTPKAQRAAELEAVVLAQSTAAMAALSESQRAAVQAVAGDDPVRVLSTIQAMRPTWESAPVVEAPASQTTIQTVPPTRVQPPAHTEVTNAQVPPRPPMGVDHLAEYERLAANPNGGRFAAAVYYAANAAAIDIQRKHRA
jgi:hypothetical protein